MPLKSRHQNIFMGIGLVTTEFFGNKILVAVSYEKKKIKIRISLPRPNAKR